MFPVDYCSPNPCKNNGVCVVEEGKGYSCVCHPGFTGFHCQGRKCTKDKLNVGRFSSAAPTTHFLNWNNL